jgi:hypothetical protein
MPSIDFEEFLSWVVSHGDDEPIGVPGQCFHSPLARFLSARMGCAYGVDEMRYGWALADSCRWLPLPRWAQLFEAVSESRFAQVLTAWQVLDLLIQVEQALCSVVLVA